MSDVKSISLPSYGPAVDHQDTNKHSSSTSAQCRVYLWFVVGHSNFGLAFVVVRHCLLLFNAVRRCFWYHKWIILSMCRPKLSWFESK